METMIPGKDRSLESTIEKLKDLLSKIELDIEEEKLINPAPGIWSVHVVERESGLFANGKGRSELAALASAYGEFVERLCTGYFFSDFPKGSAPFVISSDEVTLEKKEYQIHKILNPTLWDFYNSHGSLDFEDLKDLSVDRDDVITLLPMSTLEGEEALVPTSILKELYASNGLALGNTSLEARIQGLSEIFERYVRFEVIRKGWALPKIPREQLATLEKLGDAEALFEKKGYHLEFLDASLGGHFPVACISIREKTSGRIMLSFGAHPQMAVAVERTLTELMQGRAMGDFQDFTLPITDKDAAADPANIESHFINAVGWVHCDFFKAEPDFAFSPWSLHGNRQEEWDYLLSKLEDAPLYLWEKEVGDFFVCRLIVPGLSEIYPVEDLVNHMREERRELRKALKAGDFSASILGELPFFPEDSVGLLAGVPLEECGLWSEMVVKELALLAKVLSQGGSSVSDEELHSVLSHEGKEQSPFWPFLSYYLWDAGLELLSPEWKLKLENLVKHKKLPSELSLWGIHYENVPRYRRIQTVWKKLGLYCSKYSHS